MIIEQHYGSPMDIEWAKDGDDGQILHRSSTS
jgi:pyruvate,water dikinase